MITPKYSINFNGESTGYFPGKKDLRQWDPISPYLFVIVMDFLSQLIKDKTANNSNFTLHWRWEKLYVTHLCFAYDLLLLFNACVDSAIITRNILNIFYMFTGLKANNNKRSCFMVAVNISLANQISQVLQFPQGALPLGYLGVPLITSKLKKGGL